jgi:hypothetical protein
MDRPGLARLLHQRLGMEPQAADSAIQPTQVCHDERITFSAARCDIGTKSEKHGFRGCWSCLACDQLGESAAIYWNQTAALSWARMAADAHARSHG